MIVCGALNYIEEDLNFSRMQLHWFLMESEKYGSILLHQRKTNF